MIWAIGDVHGRITSYEKLVNSIRKSDPEAITYQVGDLGIGFQGVNLPILTPNDWFIAGNHDNAVACAKSPRYLGDYGIHRIDEQTIFFMRGATSVDKHLRTEGIDWWSWEELTYSDLIRAIEFYKESKPDIVITHDCPSQFKDRFFSKLKTSSFTNEALGQMFDYWQPQHWVFGHYHCYAEKIIGKCKFQCLAELQHKLISR